VRLKGGDPFVFGRGGEEALVCLEAGIPFEIVPGVTAGVAAPAYAGIPVTHRELASGVAFVTGHERGEGRIPYGDEPRDGEAAAGDERSEAADKPETALDWPALAAFPGTLVFYMGVRALPRIAERLIAGGRPRDEPVAVVERGTFPGQRTVLATLADVAERAAAERVRAPAITLVGPVAGLRERLAWLERRPLHGRTVAVTRARPQASALAARLRELGADVVEAPAIRTRPLDAALPDLAGFDLVCVTSPNGAHALFERLAGAGLDARALAGRTVAAIGPGTARALAEHGIRADVVPERAVAEGLVEALDAAEVRRALVVRGREGRDVLPDALRARGAEVELLVLYETVAEPLDAATAGAAAVADYVTFTSASTVRFFLEAAGGLDGPRIVSIGPATSAALREAGLEPDVEADPHTPDGLVAALVADARGSEGTGQRQQRH
jgi:uroporphyrinogen III methyltransferase/synthase